MGPQRKSPEGGEPRRAGQLRLALEGLRSLAYWTCSSIVAASMVCVPGAFTVQVASPGELRL